MPFCPSCGASVSGSYCQNCGAAVGSGSRPMPAAGSGLANNVASALCYLLGFITGVIFLALSPYNRDKTIRFHAFQSIFLSVGLFVFNIVLGIILGFLPFGVGLFLGPLISLAYIGLWLFMMWKAYQNEMIKLPIVGDLAARQA
jgi:uncharacterized membrane protein